MSCEYKNEIRQMVAYSHMNIDTREGMKRLGELDEVYRKAAAFDEIREARKEVLVDVRERGLKLPTDLDKFSMMTEHIIHNYEGGETNA